MLKAMAVGILALGFSAGPLAARGVLDEAVGWRDCPTRGAVSASVTPSADLNLGGAEKAVPQVVLRSGLRQARGKVGAISAAELSKVPAASEARSVEATKRTTLRSGIRPGSAKGKASWLGRGLEPTGTAVGAAPLERAAKRGAIRSGARCGGARVTAATNFAPAAGV